MPDAPTDLDIKEALVVHPGDTLVVRVRPDFTHEELDGLMDCARRSLPEDVKVVVVSAEQLAVIPRSVHAD